MIEGAGPLPASARVRRASPWLRALLVVALVALSLVLAFLNLGRWLEAPGTSPEPADLIVLLGGDSEARLTAGVELFRRELAPTILLAGAEVAEPPTDPARSNARLEYLLAQGVPRAAIVVDGASHNSREEAAATLLRMQRAGWRTAIVVSDPPHLRRLSWIWGRQFAGTGASYLLVSSHPRWWRSDEWWRDDWAREFVRTEMLKIGYHAAVNR